MSTSTDPRAYERLRPLMKYWYLWWLSRSRQVVSPRDEPTFRTDEPGADTILLLGNGPAHGWGVDSHEKSLVGQLAAEASKATGRPASLDYVGDEWMSIETTRSWLKDQDLGLYDVFVVLVGMNDAVRLTPIDVWERELQGLCDDIQRRAHPTARIVLVGLPPVRSMAAFDSLPGSIAEWHARRMNEVTLRIAAESRVITYFRCPQMTREKKEHGSPSGYRACAYRMAEKIAPLLDGVHNGETVQRIPRALPTREFEWSGGKKLVEQASTGGSDTLQELAKEAEKEFGVDVAVVSLLDGTKLYYAMNTHLLPTSVPRELTFCDQTVTDDDVTIIEDARKNERFKDNPYLDLNKGFFYAGHPLHSSTGETIGSFCLHDRRPRSADSIPTDRLREFALRAEAELQSYESAKAEPARVEASAEPAV